MEPLGGVGVEAPALLVDKGDADLTGEVFPGELLVEHPHHRITGHGFAGDHHPVLPQPQVQGIKEAAAEVLCQDIQVSGGGGLPQVGGHGFQQAFFPGEKGGEAGEPADDEGEGGDQPAGGGQAHGDGVCLCKAGEGEAGAIEALDYGAASAAAQGGPEGGGEQTAAEPTALGGLDGIGHG